MREFLEGRCNDCPLPDDALSPNVDVSQVTTNYTLRLHNSLSDCTIERGSIHINIDGRSVILKS